MYEEEEEDDDDNERNLEKTHTSILPCFRNSDKVFKGLRSDYGYAYSTITLFWKQECRSSN